MRPSESKSRSESESGALTRFVIALAPCALIAACAGSACRPPAGATAYGVYRFHQQVLNAKPAVILDGSVTLLPDTLTVSLATSPCTYDTRSRGDRWIRYVCGDVTFTFNRRNPLRENAYTAPMTEFVSVPVCLQTAIDSRGREVCTRPGSERVERRRTIMAPITFLAR